MPTHPMLLFVDTETTGLDPYLHRVWEVAALRFDPATQAVVGEHVWQLPLDAGELADADPEALTLNGYHERRWPDDGLTPLADFVLEFGALAGDAHLVGANPAFDADRLGRLFRRVGGEPTWHYRVIDVEALALGYVHGRQATAHHVLGERAPALPAPATALPWKSTDLLASIGVERGASQHTALADARWALAGWLAVTTGEGRTDG